MKYRLRRNEVFRLSREVKYFASQKMKRSVPALMCPQTHFIAPRSLRTACSLFKTERFIEKNTPKRVFFMEKDTSLIQNAHGSLVPVCSVCFVHTLFY